MPTSSVARSLNGAAVWLLGSLTAPFLAYLVAAQSPTPSEPVAPLNLVAGPAAQDTTAIDIPWPAELSAEACILVIGSLDEARTRTTVSIRRRESEAPARNNARIVLASASGSLTEISNRKIPRLNLSHEDEPPKHASLEIHPATTTVSRGFFLQTAPDRHQPVMTRLAAESRHVRIWEEAAGENSASSTQLTWLIERFENEILPKLTELYGSISDIDGDGKLAICLTDRLTDLPAHGSPVEGLVQANDFHIDLPRPHSNQADVLFLSRTLRPGPQLLAVLAHEAAHLAVFSRRFETDPHGFRPEDDWLNEGLAHFAEAPCSGSWSNLKERIAEFRRSPESSPLVVIDAHREGFWRNPGSRGAAWSFFAWLADEAGSKIVGELARHPNVGCAKIEDVMHEPFAEVFRRWTVAEAAANPPAIGAGVNNKVTLCGTAHHARWINRPEDPTKGWRITVPVDRRVQVTLVDPSTHPPRMWIVR